MALRSTNLIIPLVLLIVVGVAWWGMERIETLTRRDLADTLSTVVATNQEGLRIWAARIKADTEYLASLSEVRQCLETGAGRAKGPDDIAASSRPGALLHSVQALIERHGYYDFVLVAPDGTQVAASSREMLGGHELIEQAPAPIRAALTGGTALGPPNWTTVPIEGVTALRPLLIAAAPVRDETGRVLGAFVLRLDPLRDFTRVTQLGRIGESGETYAFDAAGYMVTESRFDAQMQAIGLIPEGGNMILRVELRDPGGDMTRGYRPERPLKERPLTRMASRATAGESGVDVDGYRDYRGVPVVGAWTWVRELGIGLAIEIDVEDAFHTLRRTRLLILSMLSVAVVGGTFVSIVLGRRARVLAQSMAREQALSRERDEILALVSHDLRSPLSSIHLNAEMLLRQLPREPRADPLRKRVEGIQTATERMVHLIESLLSTAQIGARRFRVERRPCLLSELVAKADEVLTPLATAKGITLSLEQEDNLEVLADPERLLQVFSNLIGNAIKFTPEHGRITVRTRRVGDAVQVSVQDSGAGMTAEELPHVFERYWRTKGAGAGSGLGLYISKGIVEAHGGRIWVESQVGTGSTFHFTVPLARRT